jgi:hypothetical protein
MPKTNTPSAMAIAARLDPAKLAKLMELAGQADVPAEMAAPTNLVDAICTWCRTGVKIAPPIVGAIVCVDCAKAETKGKSGRRYVKAHHKPRLSATPQELANADRARVDLSNYSDAELGRLVRNGVETTRMQAEEPQTTPEKTEPESTELLERQIAGLIKTLKWTREQAIAFVTRRSPAHSGHECDYYRRPDGVCSYCSE